MANARTQTGETDRDYAIGLARALGGAIIFGLPLLMTMEMWELGATLDAPRLLLFTMVNLGLLVGLSYFAGFEETFRLRDDVLDALSAYAVGVVAAAMLLWLFGVLSAETSPAVGVAQVAIEAIPASIGAVVARQQLSDGADEAEEEERRAAAGYPGELFLMAGGAVLLAFNIAPTEEVEVISHQMDVVRAALLVGVSLLVMHGFVYGVGFRGQESHADGFVSTFARFTVAGYGVALLVSGFVAWSFGHLDGASLAEAVSMTLVLAFPAAVGASIARLLV